MRLEMQRTDTNQRWSFHAGSVRVGRDPQSTLVVSEPGVSRDHALVILDNSGARVRDLQSGQGTWLNGARITEAELRDGDRLTLGGDGPEFVVRLPGARASAGGADATVAYGGGDPGATIAYAAPNSNAGATIAYGAHAPGRTGLDRPAPGAARAAAPAVPEWEEDAGAGEEGFAPAVNGIDPEAWALLEARVSSLQRLARVSLAAVAVLIALLLYQASQISANAAAVERLRSQAQGAVAALTPQLNQRLNQFDQRMDGMDAKMKAEEDHFVARMNLELPQIMDRYVNQKLAALGSGRR